jgi:hypothetical protein
MCRRLFLLLRLLDLLLPLQHRPLLAGLLVARLLRPARRPYAGAGGQAGRAREGTFFSFSSSSLNCRFLRLLHAPTKRR